MNAKHIILVALILVLAVSPALAVGQYYENKVVDYNLVAEYNSMPESAYGTLRGSLRCGDNILTPEIGVRNDLTPEVGFTMFPIAPDGTFEFQLIPGTFTLYLPDGNGGQPEYSHATVSARQISYPEIPLLGHAYTTDGDDAQVVESKPHAKFVILFASYGKTTCTMERVWIGPVTHTIPGTEAWTETIIDSPATPGTPAVMHTVHHPATPAIPAWDETIVDSPEQPDTYIEHPAVTHTIHHDASYKNVGRNGGEYEKHGSTYTYVGAFHGDYIRLTEAWDEVVVDTPAWVETVHHSAVTHNVHHSATPAIPAWQETVVDIPATPGNPEVSHTVFHPAGEPVVVVDKPGYWKSTPDCIGGYEIVTREIQTIVNDGLTSFVFDNRPIPGGIWDHVGGVLLQQIDDPAKNQVKRVFITYTKNGHLKIVSGMEYDTITL